MESCPSSKIGMRGGRDKIVVVLSRFTEPKPKPWFFGETKIAVVYAQIARLFAHSVFSYHLVTACLI